MARKHQEAYGPLAPLALVHGDGVSKRQRAENILVQSNFATFDDHPAAAAIGGWLLEDLHDGAEIAIADVGLVVVRRDHDPVVQMKREAFRVDPRDPAAGGIRVVHLRPVPAHDLLQVAIDRVDSTRTLARRGENDRPIRSTRVSPKACDVLGPHIRGVAHGSRPIARSSHGR